MLRATYFILLLQSTEKQLTPVTSKIVSEYDQQIHHDFFTGNRTCPIAHDLSARLLKSHMAL